MNNHTFLILSSLIGLFFVFSANAEEDIPITKEILRNSNKFIVQKHWIACYKGKSNIPSNDIVEVFYRGNHLYPQHRKNQLPYTEYKNKLYLRVKYNDTPTAGCFVEATSANISTVKAASVENIAPKDSSSAPITSLPANDIEKTLPTNNGADANTPSDDGTSLENVPPVNNAATENPSPVENNADDSLIINCVAPGTKATRRLETSYENSPSKLPCKVVYFREDGKTQIIAEAKYTKGYCAEKREQFLKKLKSWGWQCK